MSCWDEVSILMDEATAPPRRRERAGPIEPAWAENNSVRFHENITLNIDGAGEGECGEVWLEAQLVVPWHHVSWKAVFGEGPFVSLKGGNDLGLHGLGVIIRELLRGPVHAKPLRGGWLGDYVEVHVRHLLVSGLPVVLEHVVV